MGHYIANAAFWTSIFVICYGLWKQRQGRIGASRNGKPKNVQSFEDWAMESKRRVYEARRPAARTRKGEGK